MVRFGNKPPNITVTPAPKRKNKKKPKPSGPPGFGGEPATAPVEAQTPTGVLTGKDSELEHPPDAPEPMPSPSEESEKAVLPEVTLGSEHPVEKVAESVPKVTPKPKSQHKKKKHNKKKRRHGR